MRRNHLIILFTLAYFFGTSLTSVVPAVSTKPCWVDGVPGFVVDGTAFWEQLKGGLNPAPSWLPGPRQDWIRETFDLVYVVDNGTNVRTERSSTVGFQVFRVMNRPADSPAILWGKPDEISGLIGEEGNVDLVSSAPYRLDLLCVSVSPMRTDSSFSLPASNDAVSMDETRVKSSSSSSDCFPGSLTIPPEGSVCTPPFPPGSNTCSPPNVLYICAVGNHQFCDGLGVQAAWDKMATIIFAAWSVYDSQTIANSWTAAWLKCYTGGDPFDDSLTDSREALIDFMENEYHQPGGAPTLMHFFAPRIGGGAAFCRGQWGVGGYSNTSVDPSITELNIFLHETGHNFDASHETGDSACSNRQGHADRLRGVDPEDPRYSIMYQNAGDDQKMRVFTNGYVNEIPTKHNTCFINADVAIRLGTQPPPCPPPPPL